MAITMNKHQMRWFLKEHRFSGPVIGWLDQSETVEQFLGRLPEPSLYGVLRQVIKLSGDSRVNKLQELMCLAPSYVTINITVETLRWDVSMDRIWQSLGNHLGWKLLSAEVAINMGPYIMAFVEDYYAERFPAINEDPYNES